MRTLVPGNGLTSIRREMDRLFDRLWETEADLPALGEWKPPVDVKETKDAVVVCAEVPGMDPGEIRVHLRGDVLTIEGEKKDVKEEKDDRHYRMERTYGAFARTVKLPATVDAAKAKASFKNGVLEISILKSPASNETTIPVKVA